MSQTKKRKLEHLDICLKENVEIGSNWLEHVQLVHNACPDVDYSDIDTTVTMFGKKLEAPIVMAAITGGVPKAKKINKDLGKVAQKLGIGIGIGSQRAMIEDQRVKSTFYVRDVAPTALILGNIGLVNVKSLGKAKIEKAFKDIRADAMCVHMNSAQEMTQPEGDTHFKGSVKALSKLKIPVIAKECGAGVSRETAVLLKQNNVQMIDVGGYGGTNWVQVEAYRKKSDTILTTWGIPTAASVLECRNVLPVIATGGIRNGVDIAKSIGLGATACGMALPILQWWKKNTLEKELNRVIKELKISMVLTNSKSLTELRNTNLVITGKLREWCLARGIDPRQYATRNIKTVI